jgi:hypothetical protein
MTRIGTAAPMPLTPRELAVLEVLRADREACGDGVSRGEVAQIAQTRWPAGVVGRLVAHGFRVGELRGRYELGHEEPVLVAGSTGASDGGRSAFGAFGQSSGAPVDSARPRLFDLCSPYGPAREAA